MSLEFLQAGHHNLGEVGLLEPVGNFDGFIELAFAQSARDRRGKRPRLLARRAIGHQTIDHDTDRVGRHDEQADDDGFRQRAHLLPERSGIPTDGAAFLKKVQRPDLQLQKHRFFFSPAS